MIVSMSAKIVGLLNAWEPSSPRQEEQLENLTAIICGALNAVQNGPIHQTLRCTPAMAANVTTKLWELSDMVKVLENWEAARLPNGGNRT
jgi:hypothetical protein